MPIPTGDPLNGNRPRTDYDGFGEITDVCLKRKIRDRLQTAGQSIFVQSDEKKTDGMTSLQNRAYAEPPIGLGKKAFNAKENSKDKAAEQPASSGLMSALLAKCLPLVKKLMPPVSPLPFAARHHSIRLQY